MKLKILKNTFDLSGRKTPDILMKDSVVELRDEQAQLLIDKGVAVKYDAKAEAKAEEAAEGEAKPEKKSKKAA